jgi:branched-chain amino acid aminotransferase
MLTKSLRRFFSFTCENMRVLKKETGLKIDMGNSNLVFGQDFTIHMAEVDYCEKAGWSSPVIKPLENLSVHPGCSAIHYSLSCFEGNSLFFTCFVYSDQDFP